MNRVLVTFNPSLPRGDQGSLVPRIKDEAKWYAVAVKDYFQSVLLIAQTKHGVPQEFVDAINGDPDMLALENFGDKQSTYGYVIPFVSMEQVRPGKIHIDFGDEVAFLFMSTRNVIGERVGVMPIMKVYTYSLEGLDVTYLTPSMHGPRIELRPDDKVIIITNISWDEMKNHRNERYFDLIS